MREETYLANRLAASRELQLQGTLIALRALHRHCVLHINGAAQHKQQRSSRIHTLRRPLNVQRKRLSSEDGHPGLRRARGWHDVNPRPSHSLSSQERECDRYRGARSTKEERHAPASEIDHEALRIMQAPPRPITTAAGDGIEFKSSISEILQGRGRARAECAVWTLSTPVCRRYISLGNTKASVAPINQSCSPGKLIASGRNSIQG